MRPSVRRSRRFARRSLQEGRQVRRARLSHRGPKRLVRESIEIEGPDGIAADVCREIKDFVDANPDKAERTLVIVGRAGALYPFFRTSSLLKHIDGRTQNVPVVLLYPGERRSETGLSFMGIVNPDGDYRPRIYP